MSRDDEKQADLLGTNILYNAGYDRRGLPQFFEIIQAKYGSGGDPGILPYASSKLGKIWEFAQEHGDRIFNEYITAPTAHYGPGSVLGGNSQSE
jgi:hypothetical protein